MRYLSYLSISLAILLNSCSDNPRHLLQFSDALLVTWEHVENSWEGDEKCIAAFTFNNKSKTTLKHGNWAIFFNQATIMPNNEYDSLLGRVEHINGDFYRFVPGEDFILKPGDSLRFTYGYEGVLIKESDSPVGAYLVFFPGTKEEKIVSLDHFIAKPYKDLTKVLPPIPEIWPGTGNEYRKNHYITRLENGKFENIIPTPYERKNGKGEFLLTTESIICYEPGLENEARYLSLTLEKNLGLKLKLKETIESIEGNIALKTADLKIDGKNKEAYQLQMHPKKGVLISGSDDAGVFYGIQSLLALFSPDSYRKNGQISSFVLPEVLINDAPRFGFRGFLLDISRNFQEKEEVMKLIDLLAFYKINSLNFRMTEDEGWRIEIKTLPELTRLGSRRGHTLDEENCLPPSFGSGPFTNAENNYGTGFYTKEDFIEILKYANERHVQIVPEICYPSHARAAIKSMEARYRYYIGKGDVEAAEEFRLVDPEDHSVYSSAQRYNDNIVNIALESAYHFYETVISELVDMYKEAGLKLSYLHTGGDEVPSGAWTQSPEIRDLMEITPELTSFSDLHPYFIKRMMARLEKYDLSFGAWEEAVLKRDSMGKTVINKEFTGRKLVPYVWDNTGRNADLGYRIANSGYNVILCNVTNLYFDLAYNTDPKEPGLYWGGFQDAIDPFVLAPFNVYNSSVYNDYGIFSASNNSPGNPEFLKPEFQRNILGLQAQLWTETVKGKEMMEYYLLPKLFAYAEKAWAKASPWETEPNAEKRIKLIKEEWNIIANRIGQTELPRLNTMFGGFLYRIPLPGAVIENDSLKVNISFPGFIIRYTQDGALPGLNSAVWDMPVKVSGKVRIRAFTSDGRPGRSWLVDEY